MPVSRSLSEQPGERAPHRMGMRNTIMGLLLLATLAAAACDERILPPPLDGEGGAGGQAPHVKAAPTSSPEADCKSLKCSGKWRR